MISFNDLCYRIFNIVKPKIIDDESIDIAEVQYDVETTRAMLLKRRYSNKFRSDIPENIIQFIPKLELINVNSSNLYPDVPSDKVLMRTSLKIPRLLEKNIWITFNKKSECIYSFK